MYARVHIHAPTLTQMHTYSHTHTHTHTNTPICICIHLYTHSSFISVIYILTHLLCVAMIFDPYAITIPLSLSPSLSLSFSHACTCALSLSYTHTHTHTHARYNRQPSHLTDIIRCRVFFKDFQSILHFVEAIRSKALVPAYFSENVRVDNPPTCIFQFCGVKNRFSPGYRAIDSFGFRDLQMNLEVGFRYVD